MTRVDFYLLSDTADSAKETATCRLTQKAFGRGHRVFILARDAAQAGRLDQLLWTFQQGSFIPHALSEPAPDPLPPVIVSTQAPPDEFHDVLISLAADVPEWFSRFERVAEVVSGSDEDKLNARSRFRFYRDRGYALQTHNL
ncbi:MAG: DNA polymerase III subunit chi [Pseudomonadota bacterium]|nr:MAG: DNA polymerase III subunit chi [Pseudomonadota bacterium]